MIKKPNLAFHVTRFYNTYYYTFSYYVKAVISCARCSQSALSVFLPLFLIIILIVSVAWYVCVLHRAEANNNTIPNNLRVKLDNTTFAYNAISTDIYCVYLLRVTDSCNILKT